jgi:hypothetical protein
MKKILLMLVCVLAMVPWTNAQKVIEDFELITLNGLSDEPLPNDSVYVVNNPAPNGVNSSTRVMKFVRSKDGAVWAGFWSKLSAKYDMTDYKYFSADVMKPRISTVKFKVEGGTTNPTYFELESTNPQTKTNEWQRLNFHFPDATGEYTTIAMLLDMVDPVGLSENINIYVDNIVLRKQEVGGDTIVIEDFQSLPLNQLSNGPLPNDSLKIVLNPVKDDVNSSDKVLKFRRSSAGDPWAGFWSTLPTPLDMTTNKYILMKVLKPRISTIKFKIEGGTTNPTFFELESTAPQTKTDAWEQMVFYYPDATGTYPTIGALLDFSDPVDLAEDIVLYVDDIVSSPTATGIPSGIKQPESLNVSVFPNPVKSTLYFDNLKDIDRIVISNMVGQQMLITRNITGEKTSISVSSLTNGVYMVTVYDRKGNTAIRKIVKE